MPSLKRKLKRESEAILSLSHLLEIILITTSCSNTFALGAPSISVVPSTPGAGTTLIVTGSGFAPSTTVKVWLDTDSNGKLDSGEPYVTASVDASGAFS